MLLYCIECGTDFHARLDTHLDPDAPATTLCLECEAKRIEDPEFRQKLAATVASALRQSDDGK